jgi:alanyl-tRNA synthetase
LVIPITPFYVEAGGQVSDTGVFAQPRAGTDELQWEVQIEDTRQPISGLIVHVGRVTLGTVREGDSCWAMVDFERRWDIMRNHTATHLLHSELRYVLGEHVHQAGSLVAPDRLRFDFTHPTMMTQEELAAVSRSVNAAILANYPVEIVFSDYRKAVSEGAMALFGEKYGDVVRTLRIGMPGEPFSYELCGGTHVHETAEIGLFHIISEGSVGAGIRRIEAVTGRGAYELAERRLGQLETISAYLGVPPDQVDRRVLALMEEAQDAQKEAARLRRLLAQRDFEAVLSSVQQVDGVPVLAARVEAADADTLREMSDWFRQRVGSGVVVLGAAMEGRPNFVAAVTPDLVQRGLDAGRLVKAVARVVGGGGGGKPTLAQAGGRDLGRLKEALAQVPQLVAEALQTTVSSSQ